MIAISYRRDDSRPVTGRLYDRLQTKFGQSSVFMDFDAIPPGVDFRDYIKRSIARSDLVIAMIGPNWVGEKADHSRRIDEETDFVRLEIAYALQHGIPVIPVLINDTQMPAPEKLPADIAGLAFRNAVNLDTGIDFHHHADRLIKGICELIANRPQHGDNPPSDATKSLPAPVPAANSNRFLLPVIVVTALGACILWVVSRNPSQSADTGQKRTDSATPSATLNAPAKSPAIPLVSVVQPRPSPINPPKPTPVRTSAAVAVAPSPSRPMTRSTTPARNSILVDLKAGLVDGINLKPEGPILEATLGSQRVKKTTEMLGEGADNADVFTISFGTHKVRRYWNLLTFSDPVFRTSEDLGVGSTVGDFERAYGPAERSPESDESQSVLHFGLRDPSSHFAIALSPAAATAGQSSLKQFPVKAMMVWCKEQ
jgi:hypothetical protein